MANRYGEQGDREEQLDRDHEKEGGYGRYLPYRRSSSVTLIPKAAGGIIQPRIPKRVVTPHDGDLRCGCASCRKADPSRDEDAPKIVREMPLDGVIS